MQNCVFRLVSTSLVSTLMWLSSNSFAQEIDLATLRTFGSSGKELGVLNEYREAELLRHEGKGCLTHMWFGGNWPGYDRTRIRVYVDGESSPSIDMLLGLGHGCGFGDRDAPWGIERMGKTGDPSGVYNTHRIPFGTSIRVTAQRSADSPDGAPFWWIIRGTEHLPLVIGGLRLPERTRLKLYTLNEYRAKPLEEFDLCQLATAGMLYQVTIAAKVDKPNGDWTDFSYLEACMRAYLNGANEPLILSSGLEDYFLGTYYFNRGKYQTPLAGLTHLDQSDGSFSAYRFHEQDPIVFKSGLRLTCRCGEEQNGRVFHKPTETTYSTCVWVYEW